MIQPALFAWCQRLEDLSKGGDPLETLKAHINFEVFRPLLNQCLKGKRRLLKEAAPPMILS